MSTNAPKPQESRKARIGVYWAASCGGCDISILEIGPRLVDLTSIADIVFWPCVADFKYQDLQAYPDGYIDVFLWNGGIRNSEHQELARLVRRKSTTLVAYGICSSDGGIPALANLCSMDDVLDTVYLNNVSVTNPEGIEATPLTETPYGELELPVLTPRVFRLSDIVEVDYQIPGCPPQAHQVWDTMQAVLTGKVPPRNSAVKVGCDSKAVCDDCPRTKRNVRIKQIRRPHLAIPEPDWCLLEQGFACSGPATRSGCGALCIKAGLPCRGCYGSSGATEDQGLAMASVLGSILDAKNEETAFQLIDEVADPVGCFYRFTLSSSHLKGKLHPEPQPEHFSPSASDAT